MQAAIVSFLALIRVQFAIRENRNPPMLFICPARYRTHCQHFREGATNFGITRSHDLVGVYSGMVQSNARRRG